MLCVKRKTAFESMLDLSMESLLTDDVERVSWTSCRHSACAIEAARLAELERWTQTLETEY